MKYPTNDLIQSLRGGNVVEAYEALRAGADPNHDSSDGGAALPLAISLGDSKLVAALIKAGAEVNQLHQGNTPLCQAVEQGNIAITQMLIENGASTSTCGRNGWTPMYRAAWNGNVEMMNLLVSAGADINAVDSQGDTALSWAFDKLETVTALQMLGAQPRPIERHLLAPLDFPEMCKRTEFVDLARRLETLSGRAGLKYQFVPGTLTLVVARGQVDAFLDEVYEDAIAVDCLAFDSLSGDERGRFVFLIPTSDKYSAMAASRIGDRPDGHGTYGLIEGFKLFEELYPFRLRGCYSKGIQIDFIEPHIDRGIAQRKLSEIFLGLKHQDSSHHCDPPIFAWHKTERGAFIDWEWEN